ncbi:MFS transporter [Candidatus Francisella endociliophora]|uniref:MFS transporter n=1 Tax=Candidatus Francisella endociliophora TaxID=653937 RepID=UPI0009DF36BE|nr:MFS transporter [Francisella sp. FSC1006]
MKKVLNLKSPWLWVPSIFFMEGLPGSMIMLVLAIMYKNFGVSNTDITIYTGAMVLPWVIKPLWASLIDAVFTTRWWIYAMEIAIGILLIVMALSLKSHSFFVFSLCIGWVIAFLSSSHDIAADGFYIQNLTPEQQSFFVGLQSATYNLGKIFATGFILMLCGVLYSSSKSYVFSWSVCLVLCGVICIVVGYYHRFMLPRSIKTKKTTFKQAAINFIDVYTSFLKVKNLWLGVSFIFLFKFSESMIGAILPLFLIDSTVNGGLGLSNTFTGLAYGTISPLAIILGGLIGGYYIYRKGFAATVYIMFFLVNMPHILYIILAEFHISNHFAVLACILVEQFSFSVGLTASILFGYFMVKDSQHKTAHYAFFTGVLLLGRMIPVMISGPLQELIGYTNFFIIVLISALPLLFLLKRVKAMVGNYGKTEVRELKFS